MKKILLFIVVILFTNSLSAQLPFAGAPTQLTAWYPFCGNSNDVSGNGYSLTSTLVTATTDRFGNANTAFAFNGTSSSMNFGAPFFAGAAFLASDFSYSCWINASVAQASVIWYNGDPALDGYGIYMNNGTLGTPGNNVDVVFGGGMGLFLSSPITLNAWHHLLLTRNGNAYQFYIDGTEVGFFVGIPTFNLPTGQFTVGDDYTTGLSLFNGKIDDIAVYSVLLTGPQITEINNFNPDVDSFSLGNDTTICTQTLTLMPDLAYDTTFRFAWSNGNDSDHSITITPAGSPGSNYTLTISKPYGCSYSAAINVKHLSVGIHIGPRDTTFCVSGNQVVLNPSPVAGETFLWNDGETTGSISVSAAGTYWVVVDSADGCTGTDSTTIAIQAAVNVSLGNDTTTCDGSPVVLHSNLISGGISGITTKYTWGWDITSPPLGGITNAQTYTVTTSGTYWVADTVGKCFGVDTVKVGIVYDTLKLFNPDTAICSGMSVQVRAYGSPFATNLWSPTVGISSALSVNPFITPDTSSWYKVTASLLGCNKSDSFYIDVQQKPTVYIGGNRSVCKGDTIHINAIVTPSWYTHYIYNWSPGTSLDNSGTTVGDSVVSTVVFTAGDSTDLIIIVKTPADNGTTLKCRAVDSAEIMVHTPHPTALRDTAICPGDSLTLNPNPVRGDTYAWHTGVYLSDSNAVQPVVKPITTTLYWTQSTDQFGCHDTMFENIAVYPGAVINLGDSVTLYPGQSYQISPQTNCVYFSWQPPLGLSDTSIANPLASPAVNTKYLVRATTEWGCYVTDSININVDPSSIVAVPNAFTPGTNVNNILYVLKRGIATVKYFRIFNRWGNKVFESNNINIGWDGTYNGKPQPFDVYVYDLQAVTNDGVIFQKTGNVTLIR